MFLFAGSELRDRTTGHPQRRSPMLMIACRDLAWFLGNLRQIANKGAVDLLMVSIGNASSGHRRNEPVPKSSRKTMRGWMASSTTRKIRISASLELQQAPET